MATVTVTETETRMPPPSKYHRPSLQELMSPDETMARDVPRMRPRPQQSNGVRVNEGAQTTPTTTTTTTTTTRRERRSEFEIYRDGKGPSLGTRASPGAQLHRERRVREKELQALEEEYLNGRRGGKAITKHGEGEEDEGEGETEEAPPRHHNHHEPSAKSILSHRNPDPQLTPMPPPPLSLLHKKFAAGTTPSKTTTTVVPPKRPSKLSPTPVLAPVPADPDVSPLEHMRQLRAQFEALRPPSSPSSSSSDPTPPAPAPKLNPNPTRRPTSNTNKPTTTADLIARYTFTLSHLPALTHHSRTATLTLTPTTPTSPGHLTLNLRPASLRGSSHHTYTIPPHGLPIRVTSQHSPRAAPTTSVYDLADLPLKHLPALRYARAFVALVQRATIVGRVEVREKHGGGKVWLGRRWADGRFEAARDGDDLLVRIDGERGQHVSVWVAGRRVRDVGAARWEKTIDRAQRMWSACWRVMEEDEEGQDRSLLLPSTSASPSTSATPPRANPNRNRNRKPHKEEEKEEENDDDDDDPAPVPFHIDSSTTFVPTIGWCRRDPHTSLWCMLFLDGVRLEIDPTTGDAVWADRGGDGERRVLKDGMRMPAVRERVARFVERGL